MKIEVRGESVVLTGFACPGSPAGDPLNLDIKVNTVSETVTDLSLDSVRTGSRCEITARLADAIIHVDEGKPASATFRKWFIAALVEKVPAVDPAALNAELLRLAATTKKDTNIAPAALVEMDISSIVRPEYFSTPDLTGLTVPLVINAGGKPSPRWMQYIRWADGRRECRELVNCIDLPGGSRLWINPVPGEPAINTVAAWSVRSRAEWLNGSKAPNPAEVFRAICERIAHYIDLPAEVAPDTTATLALWSILTYGYSLWPAVPCLFVGGPTGSGKSTVFAALNQLSFRPLNSSNMTAAALFRTLHDRGGTLLLDEAERLKQSTPDVAELLSMLLAGFNHYIRAVRGFFRWLVKSNRLGSNPLDSLELVNAAVDVRRARRELDADELRRLFVAARGSARAYRGLAGEDRYMLYLVAAGTGFRANALANLTPADFDLNAATVTLAARLNKSRRLKVQPIPSDVADALRDYLTGRLDAAPVWGGTWARDHRGAEMLRIDLEAADIAYATEGPDGPEYADFHSLRHSYLTLGGRSGIDLRTLQELAGHSKPELTARYSHRRLYDLAGAVDKLPNLVPPNPTGNATELPLRLTGTDGASTIKADNSVRLGVVPGVVTGGISGHQSASARILRAVGGMESGSLQTLEMQGAGASQHRPASHCISEDDGTRTRNHRIDSPVTRCFRDIAAMLY